MTTLIEWARNDALPLWWRVGADHRNGGFFDSMTLDGAPTTVPKRARVQARQVYVYATAGKMGWFEGAAEAVEHGLKFFINQYLRGDGLFRTRVNGDGSIADDSWTLYDQAFALFCMAQAASAGVRSDQCQSTALALYNKLFEIDRAQGGGFLETYGVPYQSNPHMHLLEASLAWEEVDPAGPWTLLADEIIDLCLSRFINSDGVLREFFSPGWVPVDGLDGRIVEPGHQFEWAWLLARWGRLRSSARTVEVAKRLYEIGSGPGVDRLRGVSFNQLLDDFSIYDHAARLWPQTEWIKASAILAESAAGLNDREHYTAEARAAAKGLRLYLQTPVKGLWRDKLQPDGTFIDEPAPASSFYHIVCALVDSATRGIQL
jgi:mannose/cellobiose epimerase-like protein (N-acyl-D-glucosamine 2-epimerase family)